MAYRRHGRRRRRPFNLRRVRVASQLSIGALASLDVVTAATTSTVQDPLRIISVDFAYKLVDLGATADDGQEFGLSHSDYTAAEIEECLEVSGSIDLGNKIALEQANRLVRTIGVMVGAPGTGAGLSFNDGKPMKTKLNWLMSTGDTLNIWIRNGSGVVYTTGADLVVFGDLWVKDAS